MGGICFFYFSKGYQLNFKHVALIFSNMIDVFPIDGTQTYADTMTVIISMKQLGWLTAMIKGIANSHLNASFISSNTNAIGFQAIKKIVLSEMTFSEGKYEYKEVHAAEIPTTFARKNNRPKIFEILAYIYRL